MAALTKHDVQEFVRRDERRKNLQREVDSLARMNEPIKQAMFEHVRQHGGGDRTTVFQGFALAITLHPGTVSWKDAFLEVAGIDAAAERSKNAPQQERLSVTPVAE